MTPVQNLGNHFYFNDPLMGVGDYLASVGVGAVVGGSINGGISAIKGNNFWNGTLRTSKIPTQELVSTKLNVDLPKTSVANEPMKSLASEVSGMPNSSAVQQQLPPTGRVLNLDPEMGFTKSNFRQGLINLTGENPGKLAQAHHVFPQRYYTDFKAVGINIHNPKYGAWWETTSHLKNAYDYNSVWPAFFKSSPTQLEILDFGRKLMEKEGISINF